MTKIVPCRLLGNLGGRGASKGFDGSRHGPNEGRRWKLGVSFALVFSSEETTREGGLEPKESTGTFVLFDGA